MTRRGKSKQKKVTDQKFGSLKSSNNPFFKGNSITSSLDGSSIPKAEGLASNRVQSTFSKVILILLFVLFTAMVIIDVIFAKSLINGGVLGIEKFALLIVLTIVILISSIKFYLNL